MTIQYKLDMTHIQWIDIRSPREFRTGTIPGAINIPLFLDDAYETIGTIYKQKGQGEAKRAAMKFVADRLPEIYEQFLEVETKGKPMAMFCARGGMRSQTLKNLLTNLGHKLDRLEGGYKAYRQVVIDETQKACETAQMVVLHGMTGIGKTEILKELENRGTHIVDIEAISQHRGSMLGRIGLPEQPNQREFEHSLLEKLLCANGKPVFLEAESKRLGRNTLPEPFFAAMKRGRHIDLTAPMAFRKQVLIREYCVDESYVDQMIEIMEGFRKTMGHEKVNMLQELLKKRELETVAEILMTEYYDPKYKHASRDVHYDLTFEIQSIQDSVDRLLKWQAEQLWTTIIHIKGIEDEVLEHRLGPAAKALREGEAVAFPTETVYGIGANALDPVAVAKIFKAKGRPSDNPLIVHIVKRSELDPLVSKVTPHAEQLIEAFWPGALTLILPKSNLVPNAVTVGLKTVAVRMPSHPVARKLIEMANCPVAAPSANLSGKPSPTCGEDVVADLNGRVAVIVYGEDASIGLESTVVDLTGDEPVVLRPGGVTLEAIQKVVGCGRYDEKLNKQLTKDEQPKSPGMKYTHYSPEADVTLFSGNLEKVREEIEKRVQEAIKEGKRPGVMTVDEMGMAFEGAIVLSLGALERPEEGANLLFKTLRDFDRLGADVVFAVAFEEKGIGKAIMNRLIKAAGHKIIHLDS